MTAAEKKLSDRLDAIEEALATGDILEAAKRFAKPSPKKGEKDDQE